MSKPLFTKEEITKFAINHSTSKQMWSFSRSERFPPIKRRGYCDTFYNLPSVQMTRFASIGKGTKSDFTKAAKNQNAEFYGVKRDFDVGNLKGPCFTFGDSREKYEKVYYETNKMLDKNIPGPGKYNFLKNFGYGAPAFTMRSKGKGILGNSKYNIAPGPGTYKPVITINPAGKYPSSKIENIKSYDFGIGKEQRFTYKYNNNPAPNAYPIKSLMGHNFNSKYKSSQDKSMGARFTEFNSRDKYPGPGTYMAFSEFGIYQSRNAQTEPNVPAKNETTENNEIQEAEEEPVKEEPVKDQPEKEETKKEETKNEEANNEEPNKEEAKNEEAKNEEVKNEEVKNEEAKNEEPKNEEPKNEEPKNEETPLAEDKGETVPRDQKKKKRKKENKNESEPNPEPVTES